MEIAIDTRPLTSEHAIRGIGVHTRELLPALNEETKRQKNFKIDAFDFSAHNKQLTTNNYDIVHYPYFHPFFITLPFKKPAKKVVVTIHDLIQLIYPKHYPPGVKGQIRFWIQKFLLKNVDAIITISETSKKDICRFLEVHPDKVHVIYLAPREIFKPIQNATSLRSDVGKRYRLPDRFALYIGDVNYNKNIPMLIKACKVAKIPLVICGKQALDIEGIKDDIRYLSGPQDWLRYILGRPHPELTHYKDLLREFCNAEKVLRLGFVPDEDLVVIYNLATLYCQPSYYEGFGLPVLEAFSCGLPVLASKTQALVEIAETGALFANPKDYKDFASKIKKVINDEKLRKQLINTGSEIVKNFSWGKTAKETIEVYKKV